MKHLLAAVALVLSTASFAQAATVAVGGTFADSNANGGAFTLVNGGGDTIIASNNLAYFQGATTPASEWVWRSAGNINNRPNNETTFRFQFDLTGFLLSSTTLSGLWGIDNIGSVLLNGTVISNLPNVVTANFNVLTALSATTGFNAGVNTLDFVVKNAGGPAGFRAAVTVEADVLPSAVPLPAGGVLLLSALAGFAALRRRKAA